MIEDAGALLEVIQTESEVEMQPRNKAAMDEVEQQIIELQERVLDLHKQKRAMKISDAYYNAQVNDYSQQLGALEGRQHHEDAGRGHHRVGRPHRGAIQMRSHGGTGICEVRGSPRQLESSTGSRGHFFVVLGVSQGFSGFGRSGEHNQNRQLKTAFRQISSKYGLNIRRLSPACVRLLCGFVRSITWNIRRFWPGS